MGPLGQELGEANEPEEKQKGESASVSADEQQVVEKNGTIFIPAVAHGSSTGKSAAMKSFPSGMQLHTLGGFKTEYEFKVPQAGTYALSAWVATVQEGQKFLFAINDTKQPVETAVPYTLGMWQQTEPVEVSLVRGKNTLQFELQQGSRGVTIKEFTVTPVN